MKIIIPMAGAGQRFVSMGYKEPKPMIMVRGKRIIEYVCDMFDKDNDDFVFICNEDHLASTDMKNILQRLVKNATIVPMPPHKFGPVYTVLAAQEFIKDEEPVIVAYCDNPIVWDYVDFKSYVTNSGIDGCLVSLSGFHPHTLSSTMFAYSKTDSMDRILEIKEKACYTNNRFKEHASSGIYYFKYGYYVKKYFKQNINENLNYNGEYYITLVYNLLIKDGLNIYSYLNSFVLAFGTPSEIQNFEAWQTILDGGQVKNEVEAIQCYNYWKKYRDENTDLP
jgi:NDP-sugar pyrophosphorylase family protein